MDGYGLGIENAPKKKKEKKMLLKRHMTSILWWRPMKAQLWSLGFILKVSVKRGIIGCYLLKDICLAAVGRMAGSGENGSILASGGSSDLVGKWRAKDTMQRKARANKTVDREMSGT